MNHQFADAFWVESLPLWPQRALSACHMRKLWSAVVLSQVLTNLSDFVLQSTRRKAESSRMDQDDLARAVAENGLELDEHTATDGNCGLDALLRNLERLNIQTAAAIKVMQVLVRQGRERAWQVIRLMLVLWICRNRNVEMLPSLTLANLIAMETSRGFDEYVATMKQPREWVDTPMLLAMTAVFEVQLVVFVGPGEPQLVAAPSITAIGRSSEVPVCLFANRNNVHFYACRPTPKVELHAADDTRADCLQLALSSATPTASSDLPDDDVEPSEAQWTLGARVEFLDVKTDENLLAFSEGMASWDAFGPPDVKFAQTVRMLEKSSQDDVVGSCLETLQWRHALKRLQVESLDGGVANLDRKCRLRKLCIIRRAADKMHEYRKSQKLLGKLAIDKIVANVAKPCQKAGKQHQCLEHFRKLPSAVLRWRKVWYALPKVDRLVRLASAFSKQLTGIDGSRMSYKFVGFPVCRDAFITLTGVHADTLQHARSVATGTRPLERLKDPALGTVYCSARSWLLAYAEKHADTSPIRDSLFLPAGRKQFYWAAYYRDRVAQGVPTQDIASLSYFLQMWRQELPWIELRAPSGPFTHCGLCDFMKLAIANAKVNGNKVGKLSFTPVLHF